MLCEFLYDWMIVFSVFSIMFCSLMCFFVIFSRTCTKIELAFSIWMIWWYILFVSVECVVVMIFVVVYGIVNILLIFVCFGILFRFAFSMIVTVLVNVVFILFMFVLLLFVVKVISLKYLLCKWFVFELIVYLKVFEMRL